MNERYSDSFLRGRNQLIATFDLTQAAGQSTELGIALPVGVLTVKLAYEVTGDGTSIDFEVLGRPTGATNYVTELDANTIAPGALTLSGTVDKWDQYKVNWSAKVGTFTTGELKVWIIT